MKWQYYLTTVFVVVILSSSSFAGMNVDTSEVGDGINQTQKRLNREEKERRKRRASPQVKYPICDYFDDIERDTCFEITKDSGNSIEFRCIKGLGSLYPNLTHSIVRCENGWNTSGVGACLSDPRSDLQKAANRVCHQ
jgi:hypothetical protein